MIGMIPDQAKAVTPLPPATRFLLDLVKAHLTNVPSPSAAGVDWADILALTQHHRVTPFLSAVRDAPPAVQATLRDLRHKAVCAALLQSNRLRLIAERFQKAGVQVLVLKGLPQSLMLFGDMHARSCRDIDLLVSPADAETAIKLLQELGYGCDTQYLREDKNALTLLDREGGPPIELHTGLSEPGMAFTAADFDPFAHSLEIKVAGQGVQTLSPAAMIAYAAWHASRHRWTRIYWLADLAAAAINRPPAEWLEAASIARRAGCIGHLSLAVWLVRDMLGISPPVAFPLSGRSLRAVHRAAAVTRALWAHAPCNDQMAARHIPALVLAHADIGLYDGWRALRVLYGLRYAAINRLIRFCRRQWR